jgi:hypothetical protein
VHGVGVAVGVGVEVATHMHCASPPQLEAIAAAHAALIEHGQLPFTRHAISSAQTVLLGSLPSQLLTIALSPHRHPVQPSKLPKTTVQKSSSASHDTGPGVRVAVAVGVGGGSPNTQLVLPPASVEWLPA